MKYTVLSMAIMAMLAVDLQAADPCVSGVPVGQRPGPYSFLIATGKERGQLTCYICEQGDKPTAVVFARSLSKPLAKLLAALDQEVVTHKDKGFKAWLTELAESADLDALAKWSQSQGIKNVPVGAFEDADGPPAYKLVGAADVTVLVFVNQKVSANFAFRKNELNDAGIDEIQASIKKMMSSTKK